MMPVMKNIRSIKEKVGTNKMESVISEGLITLTTNFEDIS
jgi:hypothetical protein